MRRKSLVFFTFFLMLESERAISGFLQCEGDYRRPASFPAGRKIEGVRFILSTIPSFIEIHFLILLSLSCFLKQIPDEWAEVAGFSV